MGWAWCSLEGTARCFGWRSSEVDDGRTLCLWLLIGVAEEVEEGGGKVLGVASPYQALGMHDAAEGDILDIIEDCTRDGFARFDGVLILGSAGKKATCMLATKL